MSKNAEAARIQSHIANLASPEDSVAQRAKRLLRCHYGTRALPQLLGASQHENPQVRYHAACLLGHTHAPEAFEPLLRLLDDPDRRVRYDAIVFLGELGDPRAIEPLIHRLAVGDDDIAGAPGLALSKLGTVALPQVQKLLAHEDAGIRRTAVDILGGWAVELGDSASLDALRSLAVDANADVREDVQYWLEEAKNHAKCQEKQGFEYLASRAATM